MQRLQSLHWKVLAFLNAETAVSAFGIIIITLRYARAPHPRDCAVDLHGNLHAPPLRAIKQRRRHQSAGRREWMANVTTPGWSGCSICHCRQRHQDGKCRPSRRKSRRQICFVRRPCRRRRVLAGHSPTTHGIHRYRSAIWLRSRRSARAAGWGRRCQRRPRSRCQLLPRPPFPLPACHSRVRSHPGTLAHAVCRNSRS